MFTYVYVEGKTSQAYTYAQKQYYVELYKSLNGTVKLTDFAKQHQVICYLIFIIYSPLLIITFLDQTIYILRLVKTRGRR
jgi:predicted choloylglycine hydrolase